MRERLSIFLSGTRRDVPGFWVAAREALTAAFPDFAISMMEDAEPEDITGDHWSRREATKPDVLIGLVGRFYGHVPSGHDRSVTEQEFDVAGQVGIERLMFTTESCPTEILAAQSPVDQGRVQAFRRKIDKFVVRRGVTTKAKFAEHVVTAVQQWERRTLRGALQDTDVYFAPLLKNELLYSHTEKLIGQGEALQQLDRFRTSDKRILLIHAPWGRGKSRLLLEFSRIAHGARFLREDIPLTRQHLDLSAADPMVIVIDDLQRRDDSQLRLLLAFFQRCTPDVKLLAASRTNRIEEFSGLIRDQGLPMSDLEFLELPALTDTQQHELVVQVLGVMNEQTFQVAVRTRGSTLAALLASRMIRRQQTSFTELDENPDFVSEVLGRFRDALLLSPDLDASMRDRLKGLLQVIAICGPVRPANQDQRETIARFLARTPEEVSRDVELLEDRGLLLRRGGLVTIPIDAVRETEALRACVTSRGELTGLAERALRELAGVFRGNLLRNLALVDFRAERAGQSMNLLDHVWPEIEGVYDTMPAGQRLDLLRDLKDMGLFQPRAALRFVSHALPSGLGPPETDETRRLFGSLPIEYVHDGLSAIVRGTLYHAEFVAQACDLLWAMAQPDSRPARHHIDSAERALVDLATLDADRAPACYEEFLGWAEANLERGTIPGKRMVAYLRPLLTKELQRGYSDESAMQLWAQGVIVEKVRPLHDRALLLLGRLAREDSLRTASEAISAIGDALRPPDGAFGRKITEAELVSWEPEQLQAMEHLESVANGRQQRVVDLCVLATVDGMARYSEQPAVKMSAMDLERDLLRRLANSIELALMPSWLPPWDNEEDSQEGYQTSLAATAKHLVDSAIQSDELTRRISGRYDEMESAGLQCQAWTLLNELTKLRQEFGTVLLDAMIRDDPPVAEHASGALSALLDAQISPDAFWLDRAVIEGNKHLHRSIARGYFSEGWRQVAGEERFLMHSRRLLDSSDLVTRVETIRAIWMAREFPPAPRAAILLDYNPADDPPPAYTWSIAVRELYPHFTPPQRAALAVRLKHLPSLDHYGQDILAKLSADDPGAVVDILLARIEHSVNAPKNFEAVPRNGSTVFLAALPAYERERGLMALGALLYHESYGVRHAAEELFARLGGADPAVRRRVRLAWVGSGDQALILCAAQSFRREPSATLFEEEEVVVAILRAALRVSTDLHRLVTGEMLAASSTEIRTGSAKDADYLDARIRDRAHAVAAGYGQHSPEHSFYTGLANHAQSVIDALIRREDELTIKE